MIFMIATLKFFLIFLPAPFQVFILGVLGVLLLFLVFRLIGMVLDAIPFL